MNSNLEKKLREAEEKFNSLCLLDNAMMNFAFKDNIPAVQHVVRVILDKPDLVVKGVKLQEYEGNYIGHSCTFDITAIDSQGTHYNIEMQNDASGTSSKRSRYHSSMIDYKLLPKGAAYTELPDSYVIFITRGNVLGFHLPIIHIDKKIRENNVAYDDGSYIIFVNADFNTGDTPLSTLMHDLTQVNPDEIKGSKELYDALYYTKEDTRSKDMFIDNYCGNEDKLWKEALITCEKIATEKITKKLTKQVTEQVTKQVTQEVTKQVTEQVTKQVTKDVTKQVTKEVKESLIRNFYKNGLSPDLIAKYSGVSIEDVQLIVSENK